ncbi:MAG: hypothetical protein ATN31_05075 [Candidatus Epulonipiscioides saccharophilum]|nr:MAG: hypothetical protein ATN31_05075 [Epulopiscium sp. AS2M-Bin001]
MKTLLVAINAKYIHSNLAIHYIKEYSKEHDIETLELSINLEENNVIQQIYKKNPDIIGFSCYIWNIEYIKNLIKTIKKILPDVKIILGGPEVSFNSENLLDELPIDLIMIGEGEFTWKQYLNLVDLKDIPGIIYKMDGQIIQNSTKKIIGLDELPFVYKNLENFQNKIIYYEASRGCPFSCSYCMSSLEKGVRYLPLDRVLSELNHFLRHKVTQVKFVDRTFNTNQNFACEVWKYIIKHDNGITNFHFEISAELITKEMLYILQSARIGLIQFEIGVQTTNKDTLTAIKRPMAFEKIRKIVQNLKQLENIHLHLDLIVGLPYEDYHSFRQSFNDVISLRPDQLQLGFLKVLKGSQIRHEAQQHGIVYKDNSPYEVLKTNYISYEEISKLHIICEMVERYYNSNRFERTLNYLFEVYPTPFFFFEKLAQYWEEKCYLEMNHKKEAYYLLLLEFLQQNEYVNFELIKELIKFDWLLHENTKMYPQDSNPIKQESNPIKQDSNSIKQDQVSKELLLDILKNPEIINRMGVAHLTMKQRQRVMRLEYFKYDVTKELSLSDKPISILFLYQYAQNRARWLKL